MCLIVEKRFSKPIPEMECWKVMEKINGRWVTAFRSARPVNGVLTPDKPRKTVRGSLVAGGFIHAYTSQDVAERKAFAWTDEVSEHKAFKATAYNVRALGDGDDLICEKLVIHALKRKGDT